MAFGLTSNTFNREPFLRRGSRQRRHVVLHFYTIISNCLDLPSLSLDVRTGFNAEELRRILYEGCLYARRIHDIYVVSLANKFFAQYFLHAILFTDCFAADTDNDTIAATRPILPLPSRTAERTRRPRLFHEAFVRSVMNSVSFVEGGSFLLAPSKLRSLHRRDGKGQRRRDTRYQGGGGNL